MRARSVACAVAFVASVALSGIARADPINTNQWYTFGFSGIGNALQNGVGFAAGTNPAAPAAPDAPWTFTLTGAAQLIVLDGFLSVDQFEIFNFGASLGSTSIPIDGGTCGSDISCAFADPNYSRGVFALGPGNYSITGTQIAGVPGAGFLIVRAVAVPEPGVLALLVMGAAGLTFARRRSKDKGLA